MFEVRAWERPYQIFTPETQNQSCHEQLDDLAFQTMQQLAQTNTLSFFNAINNTFLCHPNAEQALTMAALKNPESAADYLHRYAHIPYLMRIIRTIVPKLDTGRIKAILKTPNLPEDATAFLSQQLKAKLERESLLKNQLMPQSDSFHRDGRLADWAAYQPEWFNKWTQKFQEIPIVKLRTIITRNLYALGIPPSEQAVDAAAKNLIEQREAMQSVHLFRGRNVILAANSEQRGPAGSNQLENRFGPQAVQNSITHQGGTLQLIRGGKESATDEVLEKIKKGLLQKIRTAPPPFTFMFDGHGSDVLHLTNDIVNRDLYNRKRVLELVHGRITIEELATAFLDRQKNFPELAKGSIQQQDIIVFSSCFSHSFTVRLYEILASKGTTLPIVIGMAEYGQYGFSDPSSKFGSEFAENTLGLKNGSSTLGMIMRQSNNQKTSSPFVYIPYRKKPMQIL